MVSSYLRSSANLVNHSVEIISTISLISMFCVSNLLLGILEIHPFGLHQSLMRKENMGPYFLMSPNDVANSDSSLLMYLQFSSVRMLYCYNSSLASEVVESGGS